VGSLQYSQFPVLCRRKLKTGDARLVEYRASTFNNQQVVDRKLYTAFNNKNRPISESPYGRSFRAAGGRCVLQFVLSIGLPEETRFKISFKR